ncbi:oxamate carbamoyltransferase subunit AllG family protein, partial [Escherichia coli]|uniref:oxamate carbamoyltransferase subunit AllG family protein n=1 Tax=Escherichia coli TaxID=562 RepID=UPI0010CB1AA4
MDAGAMIRAGSIVTAMTRNGNKFGSRVSGLGERWFTAPVNTQQGLFVTGVTQEEGNPERGESAMRENGGREGGGRGGRAGGEACMGGGGRGRGREGGGGGGGGG